MSDKHEVLLRLYEKVLDLTRKGRIDWRVGNEAESVFSTSFARSSLELKLDYGTEPPYNHIMELYNSNGNVVAYFSEDENIEDYSEPVLFVERPVEELYQLVVDQVYRPVETAYELLGELDKLEKKAGLAQ